MRLNLRERQMVTKIFKERYRWAFKKEKTLILNEFVEVTGYHRCYARTLLRGINEKKPTLKKPRKKPPIYDDEVRKALEFIWEVLDRICSRRMKAAIPEILKQIEHLQNYPLKKYTKSKLLSISPSTIDRLLKPIRFKFRGRGTSTTRQPRFLIDKIPIKTFGEWKDSTPGFTQVDLIAHNGGNVYGGFFSTLCATDVCTGWTVCILVKNKTEFQMLKAFSNLRKAFPFPLLGFHSDNGSEFINDTILRFAVKYRLTFTRGRPHKKNDNPHIEQKNYSVVRRNTGYLRLDKPEHAEHVKALYSHLNLYNNFFLPIMILIEKHRIGSKGIRKYDEPKSPYRRVLERKEISKITKKELNSLYESLNIFELKEKINHLQSQIVRSAAPIRNPIEKVRIRRKKGITHTTPVWRREMNSETKNPFIERQRLEELRRATEKVWNNRK
ncbi:DDE-type integrase/transposase/recombinase [Leptospira ellisii]|uniref:DDE-type integrase/transposase/recombinase n=1 Tax=Leptospira ellisii TaxID=2023197 RepID=A0A2N0B4H5_9LEPT|nr:DDE-type integrase/transposase/recombinase [Leptospira ellisii]MDV6237506.1 DDE-type integrase/transposase/recombinase [Leptospira ellisii]PJZ91393.1 ISNCY family transposase [Leptospira ellisii]PKA03867.1 ISNCY family transposase [Leptospira ellisii]